MSIEPGPEGQPLPAGAEVFRLAKATNNGQLGPEAFHLSSEDKAHAVPRLSVWETTNTTLDQANALTSGRYALAGHLAVDDVRKVRPDPDHPAVRTLDVEWERAREKVNGVLVELTAGGAAGHCGITKLDQERAPDNTPLKSYRKSLYAALARLANRKVIRIPAAPDQP
jgi:hypothetical protein